MNNVFLVLSCISLLCIPVFIIWAIVNLILRKPAKKRFISAGVSVLVLIVGLIGFGLSTDDLETPTNIENDEPVTVEEPATEEPEDAPDIQPSQEPPTDTPIEQAVSEPVKTLEDDTSSSSDEENDIATEDETESASENALDFNVSFSDTYRNDVTGNWRLARIAEDINIEEYAVDYYKSYFKSDSEVHIIINFTLNTTTRINVIGNLLDVTTMEYVDKEEHDAKLACTGMILSEYHVNIDTGEIEKIQ